MMQSSPVVLEKSTEALPAEKAINIASGVLLNTEASVIADLIVAVLQKSSPEVLGESMAALSVDMAIEIVSGVLLSTETSAVADVIVTLCQKSSPEEVENMAILLEKS